MSAAVCSICGQGGYWVAFDGVAGEDRCVNHLSANGGRIFTPVVQPDDLSSGGVL